MPLFTLFGQFVIPTFFAVLLMVGALSPKALSNKTIYGDKNHEAAVIGAQKKEMPEPPHGVTTKDETPGKPSTSASKSSVNVSNSPSSSGLIGTNISESPQQTIRTDKGGITTAQTVMSVAGKTVNLSLQFPRAGGTITGSIQGDCHGSLGGQFSTSGSLSGDGIAKCQMGFVSVDVAISYTGVLSNGNQATIHYTASALDKTETGDTTLILSQ